MSAEIVPLARATDATRFSALADRIAYLNEAIEHALDELRDGRADNARKLLEFAARRRE